MLEGLGARIRARAQPLLDAIAARGEFDAVLDLASPLPLAINAEILGIPPEDQARLKGWSDEIFAAARNMLTIAGGLVAGRPNAAIGPDEAEAVLHAIDAAIPTATADAMAALREYFLAHIERRRARPGNDLVSALLTKLDGDALETGELLALALLLLFAGNETTTNLIANGLRLLGSEHRHRDHLVAIPALMGNAVEEVLRYDSPVQMLLRYATVETTLGGTPVPAGAAVLVMLGAANRDPTQFAEPDRFDIGRRPNPHVAFGDGIHTCLGSQLARLQGQIVLGAMVERFPALRRRDPDAPLEYSGSLLSRGLSRLPMAIE
jgi:cytochrome P450